MNRHVAFLRGINLGRRRVKMDDLRRAFEAFGLSDVATWIASGNVIFPHSGSGLQALEAGLEAHLAKSLGYDVATFIRSVGDLERITQLDLVEPARAEGFNLHVIFLRRKPDAGIRQALAALEGPDDQFHVPGRDVLWLRRGRLTDSPVNGRELEKALGSASSTMRNLNTVKQIVARYAG
ncbi:MAG TPA: DUF1697 domain-containing protein [Longimicrobiales bacterium]|nr:DUF1697 domain-containing protein [Longimicrobiales bacterium]